MGILGNEKADLKAKGVVKREGGPAVNEGGIRVCVTEGKKQERVVKGFSMGRVLRWSSRLLVTAYSQLRTRKRSLSVWRQRIGKDKTGQCRRCDIPKTGTHVVLGCMDGESFGWRWSTGRQMDEKHRWSYIEKGEGEREVVIDLLEEWHDAW